MPINVLFDLLAPIYDRVIREPSIADLKQHLKLPNDGWLLDAGGGTGRVSSQIRSCVGRLVIADLSRPMLKQASRKQDCCFLQTSTDRLPFNSQSINRILVVDALHHFNDQFTAISEFMRILKPGGRLLIQEPDIHHPAVKMVAVMEKLALMGSHFHPWQEIKAMGETLGYNPQVHLDQGHTVWIIIDK